MKYLSNWQPLANEDRHTALLFGFMRHAPVAAALNPWLSRVLDKPVNATPLSQQAFWPSLRSVVPGSVRTEPELVFFADDGAPLTVVVEVKPGYGMLQLDQICREVVDVASATGASRVACVMIGADLGPPMDLGEWRADARRSVAELLPDQTVDVDLAYASFASLGRAARSCAESRPEWSPYAEDVLSQLRRKGLLGYEGAPMIDDLGELTIPTAVETFNRSVRAAKDFLLLLHGQPRFAQMSLLSWANTHKMYRNGGSEALTQPAEWFETTVAMCVYKRESWAPTHAVFVCFDLLGRGGSNAELCVGACDVRGEFTYGFVRAEPTHDLTHAVLGDVEGDLHERAAGPDGHWLFDRRPWVPGQGDEDVEWALSRLKAATRVWDSPLADVHGLTTPEFEGVSTERLRNWLRWWEEPTRSPDGSAEAGRTPADEVAKLRDELRARGALEPEQASG